MKRLSRLIVVVCVVLMFGFIIYGQLKLKRDFYEHWHYFPPFKERIELTVPKFSDNIPYNLTPKPKWEDKIVFWSYTYTCYGR